MFIVWNAGLCACPPVSSLGEAFQGPSFNLREARMASLVGKSEVEKSSHDPGTSS
jgi:hypothetical protein